jgi:hypothetical protein
MARSGLHTEAFNFDGYFVNEYALHPPIPKEERQRMVRQFLADHPNRWRAYRSLLRAWHPKGLGFLKGLPNAMYYVAEGHDQAAADRIRAKIARITRRHGGRDLPTTIPFGLRYGPYLNVGDIMANRQGEVNFPINAKFQASKAADAMRAFEAFVADNRAMLDKHGIRVACSSLLHGHFWASGRDLLEAAARAVPDALRHRRPPRACKASRRTPKPPPPRSAFGIGSRACSARWARHVQWAKAYPFKDAREGETAWTFLREAQGRGRSGPYVEPWSTRIGRDVRIMR